MTITLTEERRSILNGILNCIRIHAKIWKYSESESELLLLFGAEDNVTKEEIEEFFKDSKDSKDSKAA